MYGRRRRNYKRNIRRNVRRYPRSGRRYYARRRRNYSKRRIYTKINRQITGIPDRTRVKLKFVDFYTMTSLPSVSRLFRGNGPYDPDATGVGGSCVGWNQWAGIYNQYRCFGSAINIKALNISTASTGNSILNLVPQLEGVSAAYNIIAGWPYVKNTFLAPVSAGSNGAMLSNYMSTQKIYGEKISQDNVYASSVTSVPTSQWFWIVQGDTFDQTTSVNIDYQVTMTYYIEFFDRANLS